MDLKIYKGTKILQLIDHATCYSSICVISSKGKEVIVDNIFKFWIALFGSPSRFLDDNGGEFNNDLFHDLSELLGTKVLSTAAESPWSNDITKRHNAIHENMLNKIIEEINCSLEVALSWALSVKNSLQNHYGYSSNQFVFERNPNIQTVFNSDLPALEGLTSSQLI